MSVVYCGVLYSEEAKKERRAWLCSHLRLRFECGSVPFVPVHDRREVKGTVLVNMAELYSHNA